jgi:hypothetical protein
LARDVLFCYAVAEEELGTLAFSADRDVRFWKGREGITGSAVLVEIGLTSGTGAVTFWFSVGIGFCCRAL